MTKVEYECGCTAGGDLISHYCPVHPNSPIVAEFSRLMQRTGIAPKPDVKLVVQPDWDVPKTLGDLDTTNASSDVGDPDEEDPYKDVNPYTTAPYEGDFEGHDFVEEFDE